MKLAQTTAVVDFNLYSSNCIMENDGQYGLLDSNDLLSGGDLLPDGTRVFSSVYNYSRMFWKLLITTIFVVSICFFGVVGCDVSTPAGTTFLILFFLLLTFGLSLMYWAHKVDLQNYQSKSSAGAWHMGIIVFQTGTVVYRTKTFREDKEITFEASEIEEVKLTSSYSLSNQIRTCGGKGKPDCQYIHFSILPRGSSSAQSFKNHYIDCSELKESGQAVVEYIKEVQLRASPRIASY